MEVGRSGLSSISSSNASQFNRTTWRWSWRQRRWYIVVPVVACGCLFVYFSLVFVHAVHGCGTWWTNMNDLLVHGMHDSTRHLFVHLLCLPLLWPYSDGTFAALVPSDWSFMFYMLSIFCPIFLSFYLLYRASLLPRWLRSNDVGRRSSIVDWRYMNVHDE